MGFFSSFVSDFTDVFSNVAREFKRIVKQVTSIFSPEIPDLSDFTNRGDTNESKGVLINLESNNAPIPVIYGERKVGGIKVFKATSGSDNEFLYIAMVLAEGEVDSIGDIWLDDVLSTDSRYSGFVTITKHLGTDDQAADSTFVAAGIGWTTAHRLRGLAYLAIRLKWDPDAFRGEPKIHAKVKGRKLFDVRDSSTAWSDNAALCLYDYLTNARYGKGLATSQLSTAAFDAAADDCDESVTPFSGGPARSRFRCNAVIDTGKKITDNVRDMLFGMRGMIPWSEGIYSLIIEGTGSSELAITENEIVGGISVTGQNKRDRYNRVIATFTNPNKNWQDDEIAWPDTGSAEESTLLSDDNGFVSEKRIRLRTVTDLYAARDIAKWTTKRSRSALATRFVSTSEAFQLTAGDLVALTHSSPAWTAKLFRLVEADLHWNGEVTMTLLAYDASIYTWEETTEEESPPNTNFPDPFTVQPPSGLTAASGDAELFVPGDGTVVSRMLVTWNAPADAYVTNYELEFKKSSEADFTRAVIPGSSLSHYIFPVEDGVTYDVRIRSINIAQVGSSFVSIQHVVAGKTAAPSPPTTFTVTREADGTRVFEWTHDSVPADVRVGGGYRIKYQLGNSITWASATLFHTGLLIFSPLESNQLAAGQYTFEIRTVDSSSNESATGQILTATLGNPRLSEVLLARFVKALGWPGMKTDCFVNYEGCLEAVGSTGSANTVMMTSDNVVTMISDNVVKIASGPGGGSWNNLPNTWAELVANWNQIVVNEETIVYETLELDLGVDVNFNPLASFEGDGAAVFKMKTGTAADGSVVGSWVDLTEASQKRYFQLQMTVTDTFPIVRSLILLLDGERLLDEFEDIVTGSESASWFESIAAGHFKIENRKEMAAISMASIRALQSVGSGWTWEILSKDTTVTGGSEKAAEFKVYNSSGTLADATIDAELRGPK